MPDNKPDNFTDLADVVSAYTGAVGKASTVSDNRPYVGAAGHCEGNKTRYGSIGALDKSNVVTKYFPPTIPLNLISAE